MVLALGLACLTARQVGVWHDELSLWGRAVQVSSLRPRVRVNYGRALQIADQDTLALQEYQRGIALSFDDRRLPGANLYARLAAETDIATVLIHQQNVQGAWNQLAMVLNTPEWPLFPYAVFHRGVLEAITGQCHAAARDWLLASHEDGTLVTPTMPKICLD